MLDFAEDKETGVVGKCLLFSDNPYFGKDINQIFEDKVQKFCFLVRLILTYES